MINILQFATNKRLVIGYLFDDGYMSYFCFNDADFDLEKVKSVGKQFLIQNRATEKNIGGFIQLSTFDDGDGAYIDFEDVAEGEEILTYRIYINGFGYFESWDLIE